jgi:hypothetical protein
VKGEIIADGARVLRRWFAKAWPQGGSVNKPPAESGPSRSTDGIFENH